MSQITIRIRDDGPLLIEGTVVVLDADGNPLPARTDKPAVALCRCGASQDKPFCDGSHRSCDFISRVRAPQS